MRLFTRHLIAAAVLLAQPLCAFSAEPVKRVAVYVQPYYEAARAPGEPPKVNVGRSVNALLASSRREDILTVRDGIMADSKMVTPMTMMVLAIRLYDVDLRDESVFWFYVAKDRFILLADVLDIRSDMLSGVEIAIKNFNSLAGPIINGYAFCNLEHQKALRNKALDWVESNTYAAMFLPQIPARPGDRATNLRGAIADMRERAAKERAYFDDPNNLESFFNTRKKNEMDAKFCWK